MQPKARMTFRFDNAAPTPAAEPTAVGLDKQPTSPQAIEEQAAPARKESPAGHSPRGEQSPKEAMERKQKQDYQAWNSPYQDDILALEEMIRTTEREPVAGFSRNRQPKPEPKPEPRFEPRFEPKHEAKHEAKQERKQAKKPERTPDGAQDWKQENERDFVQAQAPEQAQGFADSRKPWYEAAAPKAKRGETIPFPKAYQGRTPIYSAPDPEREEPLDEPELPESPDRLDDESYRWIGGGHVYREDGPSWMRVFITVVGAIATGGLFGYLLLTLFTGEPLLPSQGAQGASGTGSVATDLPAMANAQTTDGTKGDAGSKANAGAGGVAVGTNANSQGTQSNGQAVNVVVPSVSLYVLQHGVFRTEESMKEAAQKLLDQGIAAATDTTEGYRVYAGISPTKADADELVALLGGTEVYVKALDSDSFQIAGVEDVGEYIGFLRTSADLYSKIAGFASETLAGKAASEEDSITAIRTAHQLWQEQTKASSSWIGTAKTSAQKEIEQLNAAVNALNSYADSPEESLLWKAQTAAMNAVFADRQLRSFIQMQAGG